MELNLPTPDSFPAFPYDPPYDIQLQLMRHLYATIEQRKVTIVESPTGTGKTLSLLCASLSWLADENNRARKAHLSVSHSENVDWVLAQSLARRRRELDAEEEVYSARLTAARRREAAMRKTSMARDTKKRRVHETRTELGGDESVFLPEGTNLGEDDNISPNVRALMQSLQRPTAPSIGTDQDPTCIKVYYASRTHSQLTQIIPELRRLKFPVLLTRIDADTVNPVVPQAADTATEEDELSIATRTVSLGSRNKLCINDKLRASRKDFDDGCRELLEGKQETKCPHLPAPGDEARMFDFRDQILASPKDIEDLATAGRVSNICPYFGSRRAIPQAELVILPYNLLLLRNAREALGIDVKNHVVIIDEAHNLVSTLLSLSSVCLPFSAIRHSLEQISAYVAKFRTRLSPQHMLHLKRLIAFLAALKKYTTCWVEEAKGPRTPSTRRQEVMSVSELVHRLGRPVEGINLLEIQSYLQTSKIARRVAGYCDNIARKAAADSMLTSTTNKYQSVSALHLVESFLLAVSTPADDGRVIITGSENPADDQGEIKYQLLNPSTSFQEIIDSARSVILAGGTMSPMSDIISQLFGYLPSDRLTTFSCGHIIPVSNLRTLILCQGPRGQDFLFNHSQRENKALIEDLGQTILNLSRIVPRGMVVFFPSYGFLKIATGAWEANSMLSKFSTRKKVLLEPEKSETVEAVLREYAAHASGSVPPDSEGQTGALLLAVTGAKLSEGLNFADDLARAVVVVGLPYANMNSPELQERMKYVNRLHSGTKTGGKDAGSALYQNMCMSAVNQSIGRAIRHKGDWAALVLLDKRYASPSVLSKLPSWIGDRKEVAQTFGQAVRSLGAFFNEKKINCAV